MRLFVRYVSVQSTRALLALLMLGGTTAAADKLDDFKEAVKQQGCYSIPYSDLRNTCTSQQNDVHPWCDGPRGP